MLKIVDRHFIERWIERMVNEPKIPRRLIPQLLSKCYEMVDKVSHHRELVIIDDLELYGVNLYESEVCVIIEDGRLKTMWRRNENSPKTEYGSRVDNVRWCY